MSSTTLPQQGRAIVKQVLSGDTIILRGKPSNGPPPEKVLSLANLQAPRLGTAKEPEKEEPFAFQSREFLRNLLIGKEVLYTVSYTTTTNSRDFGSVVVQHSINGETNINRVIVKEGWAKVRGDTKKDRVNEELEVLMALEEEAKTNKKGIWQDNAQTETVRYDVRDDARAFLDKYKGKPVDAILEQVRDGSTFRVCLLLPDGVRQYITLMLSGIKAPTYRKGIPNVEDLVEEHSEEAKFFVEARLLQRDIKVVLEGLSSNDNFVGSVQFPAGNIAEALLAEGLAKVVDWNITLVTGGPQRYRAAEQKAKERKTRIWKNWVGKAKVAGPEPEFDGIVTRVISGDTLIVESLATGKERRIQLASIRAPKGPEKKDTSAAQASVKEYGYDFDSREFLRSRFIGKSVHVVIDYIKPAEGQYEERECATVTHGGKNLAEVLVSRGLADIIRHRRDDDNRSSQYDQLLIALDKAQTANKGIHSTKEAPVHRIIDASANLAKAKQFYPYLQRAGTNTGVVDYVSSGSRFRIHVPSQNCSLTLVLGGIRAPKVGRPGEKSEPYGPESLDFISKRVMQRDVEFTVEGQDKVGGFIGSLYLNINDERKNVAVMSLEEGYASVHEYSASQSSNAHMLYEAERRAKESKKGLWKDWSGDAEQQVVEVDTGEEKVLETKEVIVSQIEGGGRVFLQVLGSDLDRLEQLMANFSIHHKNSTPAPYQPRNGDYCSARFTADDQWYRARIKRANPDKTYTVTYIDYGNSESIPALRLRPLDPTFNTSSLSPQAIEAKLAYITTPELTDDYGEEAFEYLRDLTEGRTLTAKIMGRAAGVTNVVLYDSKRPQESINERVVREGLAVVDKNVVKRVDAERRSNVQNKAAVWAALNSGNRKEKSVGERVVDAMEVAKKGRANMWRYGDFTGDDE